MPSGRFINLYLESLQKKVKEVMDSIDSLPFSEEAKQEIKEIITSHAMTAYSTLKSALNRKDIYDKKTR